jgi:hypothetical protein
MTMLDWPVRLPHDVLTALGVHTGFSRGVPSALAQQWRVPCQCAARTAGAGPGPGQIAPQGRRARRRAGKAGSRKP